MIYNNIYDAWGDTDVKIDMIDNIFESDEFYQTTIIYILSREGILKLLFKYVQLKKKETLYLLWSIIILIYIYIRFFSR